MAAWRACASTARSCRTGGSWAGSANESRSRRGGERRRRPHLQRHVLRAEAQPDHARPRAQHERRLGNAPPPRSRSRLGDRQAGRRRPKSGASSSTRITSRATIPTPPRSKARATARHGPNSCRARSCRRTRATSSSTSSRRDGPFTHLRMNVYPDGGVSRLRVWGMATDRRTRATRPRGASTRCSIRDELRKVCASTAWVRAHVRRASVRVVGSDVGRGDEASGSRSTHEDWLEAFAAHPRIGERKAGWSVAGTVGNAHRHPRKRMDAHRRRQPRLRGKVRLRLSHLRDRQERRGDARESRTAAAERPRRQNCTSPPRSMPRSRRCGWINWCE